MEGDWLNFLQAWAGLVRISSGADGCGIKKQSRSRILFTKIDKKATKELKFI